MAKVCLGGPMEGVEDSMDNGIGMVKGKEKSVTVSWRRRMQLVRMNPNQATVAL